MCENGSPRKEAAKEAKEAATSDKLEFRAEKKRPFLPALFTPRTLTEKRGRAPIVVVTIIMQTAARELGEATSRSPPTVILIRIEAGGIGPAPT